MVTIPQEIGNDLQQTGFESSESEADDRSVYPP